MLAAGIGIWSFGRSLWAPHRTRGSDHRPCAVLSRSSSKHSYGLACSSTSASTPVFQENHSEIATPLKIRNGGTVEVPEKTGRPGPSWAMEPVPAGFLLSRGSRLCSGTVKCTARCICPLATYPTPCSLGKVQGHLQGVPAPSFPCCSRLLT